MKNLNEDNLAKRFGPLIFWLRGSNIKKTQKHPHLKVAFMVQKGRKLYFFFPFLWNFLKLLIFVEFVFPFVNCSHSIFSFMKYISITALYNNSLYWVISLWLSLDWIIFGNSIVIWENNQWRHENKQFERLLLCPDARQVSVTEFQFSSALEFYWAWEKSNPFKSYSLRDHSSSRFWDSYSVSK